MYTNHFQLQDFPHTGIFYTVVIDESKPLDQQKEVKQVLLSTPCDIVEASHAWSSDAIWGKYAVYFPFDMNAKDINITLGTLFESEISGLKIDGKVVGLFPSQLGGITVYIQDMDI